MVKVIERKRASALPPDERRSAIIDATLPLLLENAEMVTTRQIAEASGIAEGTIFRVFADKDAVITAVIDAAVDPAPMEAALGELDPAAPLDRLLTQAIAILQRRTIEVWRLMSSVGPRFHDRVRRPMTDSPALVAIFKAHRDEIGIDPVTAGRYLRSLALSTSHPMMTEEPMPPKKIAALFLHGVVRRPSC
jgi:AcrR family transcriptional regulator